MYESISHERIIIFIQPISYIIRFSNYEKILIFNLSHFNDNEYDF